MNLAYVGASRLLELYSEGFDSRMCCCRGWGEGSGLRDLRAFLYVGFLLFIFLSRAPKLSYSLFFVEILQIGNLGNENAAGSQSLTK